MMVDEHEEARSVPTRHARHVEKLAEEYRHSAKRDSEAFRAYLASGSWRTRS
jgi:hypothetical protein